MIRPSKLIVQLVYVDNIITYKLIVGYGFIMGCCCVSAFIGSTIVTYVTPAVMITSRQSGCVLQWV